MKSGNFGTVLTAMVTPFDPQGRLDEDGVRRLVSYLFNNGSDGIVVCGTTGESPTLTHEEKLRLFRLVKEEVGSRGSVVAGTGMYDTESSIALTREAAEIGVDGALLVVPPYNKPSQEGLYQHFRAIARSAPNLRCMLYNVPGRTAQNLDVATVLRAARDVENIVSVKEASGNLVQCAEICAGAPTGFTMYSGEDGLTLPLLSIGAIGVVSVTSHLVGNELKEMHRLFFNGDAPAAAALHYRMLPIVRACFQSTTPSPAPVKAAMELLGLPSGGLRLPLVAANELERGLVRSALSAYGML